MAESFRQRINLLRPAERFSLEGEVLVRRTDAGQETRWPLAELVEARAARHPLGPQLSRIMLQLRFTGRRKVSLASHSIAGVGRFQDDTPAFRAFCLELLAHAPQARLARGGSATLNSLWLVIAGLAFGALVMVASAIAGGAIALGLDLGARMVFLLLLVASALPWFDRAGAAGRLTVEDLLAG
jgi:hypothetical protein